MKGEEASRKIQCFECYDKGWSLEDRTDPLPDHTIKDNGIPLQSFDGRKVLVQCECRRTGSVSPEPRPRRDLYS